MVVTGDGGLGFDSGEGAFLTKYVSRAREWAPKRAR